MPLDTISFKDHQYPKLQSEGFAAQYAFPFAKKICKGFGVDIGCNREEWALPGALKIDPAIPGCKFDAYDLPPMQFDFIFSSHVLEHLRDYVEALSYWHSKLKTNGVLFLYLPNCENQIYWRPWHNRKHIHYLTPELMRSYFNDHSNEWENVFITEGFDVNCSFYVIAEKK